MKFYVKAHAVAVTLGASIFLHGCALKDRVTTVNNTFLEDVDTSQKIKNLPYDHAWVRGDFNGQAYNKLYIKPVRIDLLSEDSWLRSASIVVNSKEEYYEEASKIAKYFHEQLTKDIKEYEGNRIHLVNSPGEDVLTLEIALTELELSHPAARAAALAAPIPGTGPALSTLSDPHAAFAARITDGNGRLVATVADRKFPPTRIIDLNKLTILSSAREVCALWSETMSEALNKGRFTKTEGNNRFSILPW